MRMGRMKHLFSRTQKTSNRSSYLKFSANFNNAIYVCVSVCVCVCFFFFFLIPILLVKYRNYLCGNEG